MYEKENENSKRLVGRSACGGSCNLPSAAPSALTVQAEEADAAQTAEVSGVEYQIYPTPHEMTYQDGGFDIGEVNIVYENGVDDVTKNRMTSSFDQRQE